METWIIDLGGGRWIRLEAPSLRDALIKAENSGFPGTVRGQISNPGGDNYARDQYIAAYTETFSNNPQNALRIVDSQGGAVVDNTGKTIKAGTATPPVELEDTETGPLTPILGSEELEFGPAFRAGLRDRGITLGPGGGVQGAVAGQFRRPIESRAFTNIAFNDPSITGDTFQEASEDAKSRLLPSFQQFVRTGDLFGAEAARQSRDLLNQARGFGTDFTTQNALAAGILNPATTNQAQALGDVARQAARQRFGAFARFLPSSAALGEQFLAQPQEGALTFADFLNQKIFGG